MQDAIEKSVWIDAPRQAVWSALVDSGEFGAWFGARAEGRFETDRTVWLELTHKGKVLRFWIRPVELDAPGRFAWDWPAGDAPTAEDPGESQTTRVVFDLVEENGGTRITVTESGFAALPREIAERKYPENVGGWEIQTANLKAHVEG